MSLEGSKSLNQKLCEIKMAVIENIMVLANEKL